MKSRTWAGRGPLQRRRVGNFGSNTVSVLLGNGDGTFQNQQTFSVGRGHSAVAVADLNGDGKPDVVAANQYDNTVSVLIGNGDGTFQKQQTFAIASGNFGNEAPAAPSGAAKGSTADCWNNQIERRQAKSTQLRLRQIPGAAGVPVWSWHVR